MTANLPLKARALRAAARLFLTSELAWRSLWPSQAFVAGYAALAAFGILGDAHWIIRLIALLIALAGLGWGLAGFRRKFHLPAQEDAERRLERESGLNHRPFQAVVDAPADADSNPHTAAAWRLHVTRMRQALSRLKLGLPNFSLSGRDPYAIRHGALLLLAGGLFVGWGDLGPRFATALQVWPTAAVRPSAIELWIDPPAYTDAAPIRLTPALDLVRAPTGSRLKAVAEADAPLLAIAGETETPFTPTEIEGEQALDAELTQSGRLAIIEAEGEVIAEWPLEVTPDRPPVAVLAGAPAVSETGALRFDYVAEDDYGVVNADLAFAPADGAPPGGYSDRESLPIPVPQNAKLAKGAMFRDLTPHRWAGRMVSVRMRATDALQQSGESTAVEFTLPEREFLHPVAQAIIKSRKRLDASPGAREGIARTIAALMRKPADYGGDIGVAMAMAVIQGRLLVDGTETSYTLARDMMWETALRLEDGDLSAAERALRDARERLAEAMARDAPPEEIAKLVEELKEALQQLMEAMARAQQQNPDAQPMDPNAQQIQSQDLMEMLDRIRELTEQGARDAAKDALAQVDRLLEQLSQARMMQQNMQALQQMMQGLSETQELIQRQQRLMDETFQQGQQGQRGQQGQQGQPGQRGQQGEQGQGRQGQSGEQGQGQMGQGGQGQGGGMRGQGPGRALSGQQEALRRTLGDIMRQMGENGGIPSEMGAAERAMQDAVGGLRQGDSGRALGAQGEALDQLRRAAESMAQQLGGEGGGAAGFTQNPGGQQPGGQDPLGRALRGRAVGDVNIPDASDLQRARAIRDEIRDRAGDRERPALELDYLQRLLERF